jgi:hypothetical protein
MSFAHTHIILQAKISSLQNEHRRVIWSHSELMDLYDVFEPTYLKATLGKCPYLGHMVLGGVGHCFAWHVRVPWFNWSLCTIMEKFGVSTLVFLCCFQLPKQENVRKPFEWYSKINTAHTHTSLFTLSPYN